jgi:hypothetical protein
MDESDHCAYGRFSSPICLKFIFIFICSWEIFCMYKPSSKFIFWTLIFEVKTQGHSKNTSDQVNAQTRLQGLSNDAYLSGDLVFWPQTFPLRYKFLPRSYLSFIDHKNFSKCQLRRQCKGAIRLLCLI